MTLAITISEEDYESILQQEVQFSTFAEWIIANGVPILNVDGVLWVTKSEFEKM